MATQSEGTDTPRMVEELVRIGVARWWEEPVRAEDGSLQGTWRGIPSGEVTNPEGVAWFEKLQWGPKERDIDEATSLRRLAAWAEAVDERPEDLYFPVIAEQKRAALTVVAFARILGDEDLSRTTAGSMMTSLMGALMFLADRLGMDFDELVSCARSQRDLIWADQWEIWE